jgi:hypothetical protein
MNKILRHDYSLRFAIGVALMLGAAAATAAPMPASGQFDQVATVTAPLLTLKSTDHVTFKGSLYRIESTDQENNYTPYEDIDDGHNYYRFYPSAHAAFRVPLTDSPESTLDTLRDQTQREMQGATKTGQARMNGFPCDVYSRTLDNGAKVQLYESVDPRFPYIVKTTLTIPSESVVTTHSIENVKLDPVPAVSDMAFRLPVGTKILDRPNPSADQQGGAQPSPAPEAQTPSTPPSPSSQSPASGSTPSSAGAQTGK